MAWEGLGFRGLGFRGLGFRVAWEGLFFGSTSAVSNPSPFWWEVVFFFLLWPRRVFLDPM